MRQNWQSVLLAVFLATATWFLVTGREKVDVWLSLPVEVVGMPKDLTILSGLQTRIDVRVRGPKGLIRRLDTRGLAYSLDAAELKPGPNVISVTAEAIPMAKSFEVMEINPVRLNLFVDRVIEKALPVIPRWEDGADARLVFVKVRPDPEQVLLRGPETLLRSVEQVETESVQVNATIPGALERVAQLALPDGVKAERKDVVLHYLFAAKADEMSFQVPVAIAVPSGLGAKVKPAEVQVTVAVPPYLAQRQDVPRHVKARVVFDGMKTPGVYAMAYQVEAPPGVLLIHAEPARVTVTLSGN